MAGSDWASSWYGANYNLSPQQLNEYADAVANGFDGGKGKAKSKSKTKAKTTPSKPKPRGYEALTIAELRDKAKARGLKIPSKASKKCDIIAFLRSK